MVLTDNYPCCPLDRFSHPGFAATYGAGSDGPGLLVATEDLGHAAVGDTKLARNDAGPDPVVGHLDYLVSDMVRQRSAVNEDPP